MRLFSRVHFFRQKQQHKSVTIHDVAVLCKWYGYQCIESVGLCLSAEGLMLLDITSLNTQSSALLCNHGH